MQRHCKEMIPVFIVPTGLGAEIGGHAGDANPAVKLIASVSDTLITHPNAVNASDINEMPENTLYVEGSILDRFLRGEIDLSPVWQNNILLVVNSPVSEHTINAVSAARSTIGANIQILELATPLTMRATMREDGSAYGHIEGVEALIAQVSQQTNGIPEYDFDVLAVCTDIQVDKPAAQNYLENGGVNPWGGVEAKASKQIASALNKPVAHSPFGHSTFGRDFKEVVDPRLAAEFVSECYLHCVLKGLHRAPRIEHPGLGLGILSSNIVSCLISPVGCWGPPHVACCIQGIPIIMVKENTLNLKREAAYPASCIVVENYLEAAGVLVSMKAGISLESVRRPLPYMNVYRTTTE